MHGLWQLVQCHVTFYDTLERRFTRLVYAEGSSTGAHVQSNRVLDIWSFFCV
jgi:hypothetical protein